MRTEDFNYDLPEELIAQEPAAVRDACRMLVMDRESGELEDRIFRDIEEYLRPGDLLVANETRVMPARLLGAKRGTGGQAEVFLLREVKGEKAKPYLDEALTESANQQAIWEVLVRPGKRLKPGSGAVVDFTDKQGNVALSAEVVDWASAKTDAAATGEGQDAEASAAKGERIARLTTTLPSLDEALHAVGHTPLPPYIKNYAGDEELYQTVYSRREASAAAPTAGLHFTPELIERLKAKGVRWETVRARSGPRHLPHRGRGRPDQAQDAHRVLHGAAAQPSTPSTRRMRARRARHCRGNHVDPQPGKRLGSAGKRRRRRHHGAQSRRHDASTFCRAAPSM